MQTLKGSYVEAVCAHVSKENEIDEGDSSILECAKEINKAGSLGKDRAIISALVEAGTKAASSTKQKLLSSALLELPNIQPEEQRALKAKIGKSYVTYAQTATNLSPAEVQIILYTARGIYSEAGISAQDPLQRELNSAFSAIATNKTTVIQSEKPTTNVPPKKTQFEETRGN